MAKPEPQIVEVPFGTLSTVPPTHAGPVGRLTRMIDCEVAQYTLPEPGTLPRMLVQSRGGFTSLTQSLRSALDGTSTSTSWIRPELIASTGQQLLSIDNSQPRVDNGTSWTDYGAAGTRVLTNQLSEQVLHTADATIVCPSSATIGTVTCLVWTERPVRDDAVAPAETSFVGFRNSSGVWLVQPRVLQIPSAATAAIAKVVSDGSVFWVFYNSTSKILIDVYDVHGALLGHSTAINRSVSSPVTTFWDVTSYPAVTLAQAVATSGSSGVQFNTLTWNGSVISVTTNTDTSVNCHGPLAWTQNPLQNSKAYLATVTNTPALWTYEIVTRANTHQYTFGTIPAVPDSITGWTDSDNNGVRSILSYSLLSNFSPPAGPPNDPGLRYTRTRRCDRLDVVTDVSWHQQVINQSKAFQVDDDWYSLAYYQSGSGLNPFSTTVNINMSAGTNSFVGAASQDLPLTPDAFYGGGQLAFYNQLGGVPPTAWASEIFVTQAQGSISHNVADSVTDNGDGTATWVLTNSSTFQNGGSPFSVVPPAQNSYIHITGSAISNNNTSFLILSTVGAHSVITRSTGINGQVVTSESLTGVTASQVANTVYIASSINPDFPDNLNNLFNNAGTITVSGMAASNNGTFNVIETQSSPSLQQGGATTTKTGRLFLTSHTTQTSQFIAPNAVYTDPVVTALPGPFYIWELFGSTTIQARVGDTLSVTGTNTGADNDWLITSLELIDLSFLFPKTDISSNPTINIVPAQLLPGTTKIKLVLGDPNQAYTFASAGAAFDNSYVNAILTIGNAANTVNDGNYRIIQVLSATEVQIQPLNGTTNQVNEDMSSSVTAVVTFPFSTSVFQPTWFITCLSNPSQEIAGAFEAALAYADWRYDGSSPNNRYTMYLTDVIPDGAGSFTSILPFRSQTWTTDDQIINSIQTDAPVLRSSVGIKQFTLSASKGQAVPDAGTMLIPGPMATLFGGKSFREVGINLGPEKPFLVSTGTDGSLTPGGVYQYVFTWEISNDDGSQIQSIPSPALDVSLPATHNRVTLGCRFVCPTNWNSATQTLVRATMSRTSYQNGAPTTQHYRLTSPIDPGGTGFVFSSVTGGPLFDTFTYKDTTPDFEILSEPTLYTDALQVPRQAMPAFRQGVVTWNDHPWCVGYDGAIWMGSQPTEGLATYWSRLWRIPFPENDQPVAISPLESYLLVFCQNSIWYLPQSNNLPTAVPDPADQLPVPVPLPFTNGCTGFVKTLKTGVVYSTRANRPGASSVDELWFITRSLENLWLGQPVQGLLTSITGLALDNAQRLFVSTGTTSLFVYDQLPGTWYEWHVPTNTTLLTDWNGTVAYRGSTNVNALDETATVDTVAGVTSGIAPDVTFAGIIASKVRQFMCCWAFQLVGQYLGPHHLNIVLSYPDESGQADTVFGPFTPDPTNPYLCEFNPMCIDASNFVVRVYVDFTALSPGASAKFELLDMEVGVMPGRAQVRKTGQIITGSGS